MIWLGSWDDWEPRYHEIWEMREAVLNDDDAAKINTFF